MQEISIAPLVAAVPDDNLTDLVVRNAETSPDGIGFSRPSGDGWEDVTWGTFRDEVVAVARGLVASGVGPGTRVGLMCKTRYEWTVFDFAVWFAGAVTVPVYETSAPEQVQWILSDSGASGILVETPEHLATVKEVEGLLPALVNVWCLDHGDLERLATLGEDVPPGEIERTRRTATGDSPATLIYTSGTTGRPKGCCLSHGNFIDLSRNTEAALPDVFCRPDASTLLFLPLAHVFARFIQVLCVAAKARLGHSPDVKNLVEDLGAFRPTFVLAVPRVFEKIYNSAAVTADASGRRRVFELAATTAVEYSRALDTGGPPFLLRARHLVFDRLVYSTLRTRLGGQVQYAVSGGAPLGEDLGHFFRGIGVTILEGWGLTETTAPAAVNRPGAIRIGSVGKPLPGVAVRVADDGELLVRGVNIMTGYHNNPEATKEAMDDGGWLSTGDLGRIDDDGFVTVTGRKKEIIVTAGGKNVAPAQLEDRLRAHPLVSQCIVVGDQRPFVACLVTLDEEMLHTWLTTHNRPSLDLTAAASDPLVRAEVQDAVTQANAVVSRAESIRKFLILETDFTEEHGHLTPKGSLRRKVVLKEFTERIEELYR
ncbi:MAG: long-chain acyl-CoA synthetase [Actinomycetota bacterium]|nr:long-chain acyl-CoA synthetase [Actinomycetota bacterium]